MVLRGVESTAALAEVLQLPIGHYMWLLYSDIYP
jgi:hypothetical protein